MRLRELRKARKMTMKEFGAIIGVAESTVSLYESGKRQPDYETLLKIATYFDVSVDYLLGKEQEQKEDLFFRLGQAMAKADDTQRELLQAVLSLSDEQQQALKTLIDSMQGK